MFLGRTESFRSILGLFRGPSVLPAAHDAGRFQVTFRDIHTRVRVRGVRSQRRAGIHRAFLLPGWQALNGVSPAPLSAIESRPSQRWKPELFGSQLNCSFAARFRAIPILVLESMRGRVDESPRHPSDSMRPVRFRAYDGIIYPARLASMSLGESAIAASAEEKQERKLRILGRVCLIIQYLTCVPSPMVLPFDELIATMSLSARPRVRPQPG